MKQFFFGTGERRLFGVYHLPAGETRKAAVLLCNPFGVEAVRAHRIYRVLAGLLAAEGHAVLRFDYFGTGDSAGACTEFTPSGAVGDILTAHQELTDMSGGARVFWLGLRFGAGLCLAAAEKSPRGLAGLLLWDPVIDGAGYLEDMRQAHIEDLGKVFDLSAEAVVRKTAKDDLSAETQGFAIGREASEEFQQFNPLSFSKRLIRSALIVAPENNQTAAIVAEKLSETGTRVTTCPDPAEHSWNSDAALNAFMTPMATLKLITGKAGEMR